MKRSIWDVLLESLVATAVLFVVTLLFSGVMPGSAQSLLVAFGASFGIVVLAETVAALYRGVQDTDEIWYD